jgi:ATP-dependent Lon protease
MVVTQSIESAILYHHALQKKLDEKQIILETTEVADRLENLMTLMEGEMGLLEMEKKIRGRVKQQMERNQREYYLNEQMKAIQQELGEMDDVPNEIEEMAANIKKAGMSKEAKTKAESELNKLKLMSPMSAEATVVRSYIEWMINVPWKKKTKVRHDLKVAEEVLETDHFGLEKVKERILEYLAVQQRVVSPAVHRIVVAKAGFQTQGNGVGKLRVMDIGSQAQRQLFVLTQLLVGAQSDGPIVSGHQSLVMQAGNAQFVQIDNAFPHCLQQFGLRQRGNVLAYQINCQFFQDAGGLPACIPLNDAAG